MICPMDELVFIKEPPKDDTEPFTTSEIIAKYAGVKHHAIQQLILKYESDFQEFGKVAFEMRPLLGSKTGQSIKVYHLNEEQATLLLTYLKNTPAVRAFKKELVRQFYAMRRELSQRRVNRTTLKPVRRELTDTIQDCVPDSPHKRFAYKHYTDLAYKSTIGATAAQLRKQRGAPKKAIAVDYMTADEIATVTKREYQISALIELGLDYSKIRDILLASVATSKTAISAHNNTEALPDQSSNEVGKENPSNP